MIEIRDTLTQWKERHNLFIEIFNRGVPKVFCVIILRPIKFSPNRRKLQVWTGRNAMDDREYMASSKLS